MKSKDMESIYRDMDPGDIPWNTSEPPAALVRLVETGTVAPCRTIDLGCGTGNHAIYLASWGFEVTGVDISPTAIAMARRSARENGANCSFLVADVLGALPGMERRFSFALDWELLHHIHPGHRERYVRNVRRLLDSGGRYLSVCFSEEDPGFGGKGKYRRTPLDTVLYFSSEEELSELFSRHFRVLELGTMEVPGRPVPHRAVYALMETR